MFYGISEERCETDIDCLNKVYGLHIMQVGIPTQVLNKMRIERGHRKGAYSQVPLLFLINNMYFHVQVNLKGQNTL